jgi:hypothetical protein
LRAQPRSAHHRAVAKHIKKGGSRKSSRGSPPPTLGGRKKCSTRTHEPVATAAQDSAPATSEVSRSAKRPSKKHDWRGYRPTKLKTKKEQNLWRQRQSAARKEQRDAETGGAVSVKVDAA